MQMPRMMGRTSSAGSSYERLQRRSLCLQVRGVSLQDGDRPSGTGDEAQPLLARPAKAFRGKTLIISRKQRGRCEVCFDESPHNTQDALCRRRHKAQAKEYGCRSPSDASI